MNIEQRFWDNVKKTDACWEWIGTKTQNGYGLFKKSGKGIRAHRYSYELHVGSIPDGLRVCHRCDNPACIRPNHLFLGTDKDNAEDRERKGRGGNKHKPGERNSRAKLTEENVLEIRKKRDEGISGKSLADEYGVSPNEIYLITTRKRWIHI